MFDQEYRIGHKEKGLTVSVTCPTLKTHETPERTQTSIEEMQDLMSTLGIEYTESFTQNRAHLDPGTIIGPGKLEEIATFAKDNKQFLSNKNLYTLCKTHHLKLHTLYGQNYSNHLVPKVKKWLELQREKVIG